MRAVDTLLLAKYGIFQPVRKNRRDALWVQDDLLPDELKDIQEFACDMMEINRFYEEEDRARRAHKSRRRRLS